MTLEVGIMVTQGEGWLVAQKGLLGSGKILFFGLGVGYWYIHFVELYIDWYIHFVQFHGTVHL